ncbi:MAG: response regulator transcription factor [Rubrivivax sp.]|nr:MAG: response regulator transcription factor [Rubrivivax sp.]
MRVLLVDAFPMVRAAVTGLLEQQFGVTSVEGVDNGAAAWAAMEREQPHLVLLDLRVPGGFELLQRIHRDQVLVPVLVISGGDDLSEALRIISAGAMGYVPERSDLSTLERALRLVMAGGTYVPQLAASEEDGAVAAVVTVPDWTTLPLTPRQKDVLRLLGQGLPNKLIARELGVSVETVKDHVAAVLKALGVSSRTQAVVVAAQRGR